MVGKMQIRPDLQEPHNVSAFFKFHFIIFFIEIVKGMVKRSFKSRNQKLSKLQRYKVATAEKLICTVTVWKIYY